MDLNSLIPHLNIVKQRAISGGSIGQAFVLEDDEKKKYFAKCYIKNELIPAEEKGLKLIGKCKSLKIPQVIFTSPDVLVLEFIEHGQEKDDYYKRFAEGLFEMHCISGEKFGLESNNFIGHTPQSNKKHSSWSDFFYIERLQYLYKLLEQKDLATSQLAELFSKMDTVCYTLLEDIKVTPGIVHGDLWSGNHMCSSDGTPCIFDPAAHYGHGEVDIAMLGLFGSPPKEFFDAYHALSGTGDGFELRKELYNLYHILNHLNLFGPSYGSQACSMMQNLVSEVC